MSGVLGADGETRYYAPEWGYVVDNRDPKALGRVSVNIPSVYGDAGGPWAWPIGGGGVIDGVWNIPPVGALVLCWFRGGDPQYPLYMRAHHPSGSEPEIIQDVKASAPAAEHGEQTSLVRARRS